MKAPELDINEITLRGVGLKDAPAVQEHFANWNVVKSIGAVPWPYPPDGARNYIEKRLEDSVQKEIYYWGIFLKQNSDELIGTIEYRFFDDEEENRGFWLSESHWGKGIMTDAVSITQDFVFFELGKPRLLVRSLCTNAASKAVKEKTGAYHIGIRQGSYLDGEKDEDVWEITRESWMRAKNKFR
ncbi:MAG: GNAT family N-acetyltransferase [Paracoccaceae bacterium]